MAGVGDEEEEKDRKEDPEPESELTYERTVPGPSRPGRMDSRRRREIARDSEKD